MDVSAAVDARKSVRAFLPTAVPDELIADLLAKASRAPSGGNVQPWRIYVIGSATMPSFLQHLDTHPRDTEVEYEIYPPNLWEPYRTNRYALGEQMYALLGVPREDKAGRLRQFSANYRFFDAPAAFFCFIERKMGPPQWSDLGMFLQTFMLLAVEAGLATCPQEAWSTAPQAVASFVGSPDEELLFCGMAIGYEDTAVPVNSLRSERMPLDQWATFVAPSTGS
jgi:nitroreductase